MRFCAPTDTERRPKSSGGPALATRAVGTPITRWPARRARTERSRPASTDGRPRSNPPSAEYTCRRMSMPAAATPSWSLCTSCCAWSSSSTCEPDRAAEAGHRLAEAGDDARVIPPHELRAGDRDTGSDLDRAEQGRERTGFGGVVVAEQPQPLVVDSGRRAELQTGRDCRAERHAPRRRGQLPGERGAEDRARVVG